MATYQKRKSSDGDVSVVAWVRVKGFDQVTKSFASKSLATEWAQGLERELRAKRKQGGSRKDLPTLTIKGIMVDEFLADPTVKGLKYFDELKLLCTWWVSHYGSTKCIVA
ncbi:MAG TPA: hypothetical protein VGV09_01480 [Steroidobacteraceae bacterium]|nr:hypothetical protein [Steroidobacteraceae bacterium]